MSAIFTRDYWIETIDRVIKSAAQGALLAIGASEGFNLFTADLQNIVGFSLGAALLSLLTSLISAPIGKRGTATALHGHSRQGKHQAD